MKIVKKAAGGDTTVDGMEASRIIEEAARTATRGEGSAGRSLALLTRGDSSPHEIPRHSGRLPRRRLRPRSIRLAGDSGAQVVPIVPDGWAKRWWMS